MINLSSEEKEIVGNLMMVIQAAQLDFKIQKSDAKYLAYAFIACGIMASRENGMGKELAEAHFEKVASDFINKNKLIH